MEVLDPTYTAHNFILVLDDVTSSKVYGDVARGAYVWMYSYYCLPNVGYNCQADRINILKNFIYISLLCGVRSLCCLNKVFTLCHVKYEAQPMEGGGEVEWLTPPRIQADMKIAVKCGLKS